MSLGLCMFSLEKCLFKSFSHFFIGLFVFLEWSRVSSYIFWRSGPSLRYPWQICFPLLLVLFVIYWCFFSHAEAFYFVFTSFFFIVIQLQLYTFSPRPLQHLFVDLFVGHSDWCEMVTHCGFHLHLSDG